MSEFPSFLPSSGSKHAPKIKMSPEAGNQSSAHHQGYAKIYDSDVQHHILQAQDFLLQAIWLHLSREEEEEEECRCHGAAH